MSGLLVAFDTATEAIAIGVARERAGGYEVCTSGFELVPRQANARLLEALVEAVEGLGGTVRDICGVIVGRGPGSFTGVRIGVAAAKGLAQGLGVPLAGVGTLDAIAWRFSEHDGLVGVVGDAMRGEVYPSLFRISGGAVERLDPDEVSAPAVTAARWAERIDGPIVLTGNGLTKYADVFLTALADRAVIAEQALWWPNGAGLFAAFDAAGGFAGSLGTDPGDVLPVYTRLSDAEEAERARRGSSSVPTPGNGVAGDPGGAS